LILRTNWNAPNERVMITDVSHPERSNWRELVTENKNAALQSVSLVGGKMYLRYLENVKPRVIGYTLDGQSQEEIKFDTLGTVSNVFGTWMSPIAFYNFSSFAVPPTIYAYDVSSRATTQFFRQSAPVNSGDFNVEQVWYTSKDGTRVPMFVMYKKGLQRNGNNPTLLTGYGGFNVSLTPTFSGGRYLWLEHGGVYAVANLRGGAEFGEDWHRAGMLDKKQNVFDDFIAAAEFLISDKITDKEHLAIQGGSNGGLLMGAMITQRPDLFRAVVCQVPLLDMLRYQNFLIAKFWVPEYGSAEDAKQFDWLYAYSPYHHVKPGTEYPAIMFMTADSDSRVDPMHAKKMAALMQAEAANGRSRERPILLRIDSKAGHGQGKPITKQIEDGTDVYSFLFWQLGVKP